MRWDCELSFFLHRIILRRGPRGFGFTVHTIRVYYGDSDYYTMHHTVMAIDEGSPGGIDKIALEWSLNKFFIISAYEAGLRPGDLITHINGESVQVLNAEKKSRSVPKQFHFRDFITHKFFNCCFRARNMWHCEQRRWKIQLFRSVVESGSLDKVRWPKKSILDRRNRKVQATRNEELRYSAGSARKLQMLKFNK